MLATFVYDGDGTRISTLTTPYDANGVPQTATLTAYYFGGAYELTNGLAKSYYSFAGQTIMKDTDGSLKYFLTDHLGSVVAITDDQGNLISQQRYLPFGGVRTNVTSPNSPNTDFGYTGQRNLDDDIGLMDYKARFYSPVLNRFIQPDSIVPSIYSPQMLNRFSYVGNNPINFNDPTGHVICDADGQCGKEKSIEAELWHHYKVKLKTDGTRKWETKDKVAALLAVHAVSTAFANEGYSFQEVYGLSSKNPLTFTMTANFIYEGEIRTDGGLTNTSYDIWFADLADATYGENGLIQRSSSDALLLARNNIVHELGHAFGLLWYKEGFSPKGGPYDKTDIIYQNSLGFKSGPAYSSDMWRQSSSTTGNEVFADMFLAWTFQEWAPLTIRKTYMNGNMPSWLQNHL